MEDAGVENDDLDIILLVGGSTRLKQVREWIEEFFEKEPDTSVNADEAVAKGACLMAASLVPQDAAAAPKKMIVSDCLPITLGIYGYGNKMQKFAGKGVTIPFKETRQFTTTRHNQDKILINVRQGESKIASENMDIGKLVIRDIPPGDQGTQKYDVKFAIDEDCIVRVSAKRLPDGVE